MTFNANDAISVCCRKSTAIGDQKAKACVGPESADRRFSFAAVRSTSGVWPGPLLLSLSFVSPGARTEGPGFRPAF